MGVVSSKFKFCTALGSSHVRILASGRFGIICEYQVECNDGSLKTFVAKVPSTSESNAPRILRHEMIVLQQLHQRQHPLITNFYPDLSIEGAVLVMDLYHFGSLSDIQKLYKFKLNSFEIEFVLRQCVEALTYVHEIGIIHRDIKRENVLIDDNGRVKLCDFGSAVFTLPLGCRFVYKKDDSIVSHNLPPEAMKGHEVWHALDWFSLGSMLYVLMYDRFPHYRKNCKTATDLEAIFKAPVLFPSTHHERLISLTKRLLVCDPNERLGGSNGDGFNILTDPCFMSSISDNSQLLSHQMTVSEIRDVIQQQTFPGLVESWEKGNDMISSRMLNSFEQQT